MTTSKRLVFATALVLCIALGISEVSADKASHIIQGVPYQRMLDGFGAMTISDRLTVHEGGRKLSKIP